MGKKKHLSLTSKILLGMVIGAVLGTLSHAVIPEDSLFRIHIIDGLFKVGGKLFVKSLKMLVVPLVFFSLISGIYSVGDVKSLGKLGMKTVSVYLVTTLFATTLGLTMAFLIAPGAHFDRSGPAETVYQAPEPVPFSEVLLNVIPSNPVEALAKGDMLAVIFFSLLIGIGFLLTGAKGKKLADSCADINEVMMKLVLLIMKTAPLGVFFLIANSFAQYGPELLLPMGRYIFTVLAGLLLHMFLIYGSLVTIWGKLNPYLFFRKMRSVQAFAFSTSSSNATMPATLEAMEKEFGVPNKIASFTIPLGATLNMDGTAIMQGVATVFVANVYGIDLSLMQYLIIIAMATLGSIGAAGVPSGGIIMLSMVFMQVGLPMEGIALILGVDRLLDMARTAVNVTGDAACTSSIANRQGELDLKIYQGSREESESLSNSKSK